MAFQAPTPEELEAFAVSVARGDTAHAACFLDRFGNEYANRLISRELKSIERSPLGWAALYGHVDMMGFLLARGADIDLPSNQLDTPLMSAVIWNQIDAVRYLLHAGASLTPRDKLGQTVLDHATFGAGVSPDIGNIVKQAVFSSLVKTVLNGTDRQKKTVRLKKMPRPKPPLL